MYCGECGAKNKKGARFCEECGKPLEAVDEKVSKAETSNSKGRRPRPVKKAPVEKKPMSKKAKVGIIIGVIVAVIVVAFIVIGNMLTDPKKIATEYFEAITSYDADKMYAYLDVKESDFANKKIFKKIVDRQLKETKNVPKVTNYKVTSTEKSSSGLVMYVKINYTMEGSTEDKTQTIELTKDKNKKFLFFDNWKIAMTDVETVEDFELSVMKDSTVTLEGVKVDKKYIDKEESDDSIDVYKLPSLFPLEYEMQVALPLGFTLEDELDAGRYSKSQTVNLDEENIPEAEQKKIADKAKQDLLTLYNSAITNKSWDEIKSGFEYKDADLDDLKEAYEDLKEDLNSSSSTKLTQIEYKDLELRSVDINDDGFLSMYVYAKYNYTVSYEEDGQTKTKSKSTTDGMYLTYDYKENAYRLVDASSLQTYFSRYF